MPFRASGTTGKCNKSPANTKNPGGAPKAPLFLTEGGQTKEGLRKAALVLCAVLMLCTVAAAEWDSTGSFDGDTPSSSPVIQPEQSEPSPGGAAPAVPDADNHISDKSSSQMDDSLWGSYGTHNDRPNIEPPSEKQQELEEARRAWEEDQMQREEEIGSAS